MSDILFLIGYSVGLGFVIGLFVGDWLDSLDILFPRWRTFRKNLKSCSYWELIRMSNEIDSELNERHEEKVASRSIG